MDINEIAKDTYYFSINNKLSGFITERNAIKCFEQLVTKLEPVKVFICHLLTNQVRVTMQLSIV